VTQFPTPTWNPLEADAATIARRYFEPLMALAEGVVPAFVLRGAYPKKGCQALMERFEARGYFSRETVDVESQLSGGSYLDLGTSLGRMGADREAFFEHAERTHTLFPRLFEGLTDPVATIYRNLSTLAGGKHVRTAVSTDGRRYGPAIFRIYQSEEGHRPHYDSVRRRGKSKYEVARFAHQFAGVLCVKKGSVGGDSVLYRAKAEGEVEDSVAKGEFESYATEHDIPSVCVELDAGDLYFFYTENVHEVPRTERNETRVVLAAFIAMSPDDQEIYVWS
jgi:hypothetical protein